MAVDRPPTSYGCKLAATAAATGRVGDKITVPTMFVWGDGGVPIVQQTVEQCGRYVTGEYRFETLHGVSHWMLEEKPDAVADLLLDWITAHPSGV